MNRTALALALWAGLGLSPPALATTEPATPQAPDAGLAFSLAPLYSFGGARHGFGGQVGVGMSPMLWAGEGSTGTLELGLLLGYGHESYGRSNRFLGEGNVEGATHRIEALLLAGPGLQLAALPRAHTSLQLFGGWVHAFMHAQLDNELQDVSGAYDVSTGRVTTGLALTHRIGLTERVGLDLQLRAPFPTAPAAISSYVFVSVGLSIAPGPT